MLSLLPDEKIIVENEMRHIILTNYRIHYAQKRGVELLDQSIPLEHITSLQNYSSSPIMILIASGVAFFIGLITLFRGDSLSFFTMLVLSIVFFIFHLGLQKKFIIVSSSGANIKLNVAGMKKDEISDLVNSIALAKHERINEINSLKKS
jgi:hypothetical protein